MTGVGGRIKIGKDPSRGGLGGAKDSRMVGGPTSRAGVVMVKHNIIIILVG